MPKIKLKSTRIQDINFFDVVYSLIDLKICDNIDELFTVDEYIPVFPGPIAITVQAKLKIYLHSDVNLRCIILVPLEGTNTVENFLINYKLINYFNNNQLSIISSGDFSTDKSFANIDYFLPLVNDNYNIKIAINQFENIFVPEIKPYKFLYLNKLPRVHRQRLIKLLDKKNLLDNALWSDLSNKKQLPLTYDDYFNGMISSITINNTTHDISWPDGKLFPQLYIDTYFSVITETNFELPYNYCTEKIYKPILMGHPFIAVANYKFYQHLNDRGYKTFNGLIDESFDLIENNDDRLLAIANSIEQLCLTNLDDFLIKAKPICEHNRLNFFREYGEHSKNNYNTLSKFFEKLCLK